MRFRIDYKSGKAVYLQVVEQVRQAAASGAVKVGEGLPSIRQLAEELRVNRNTIAKAFAELERQGVIETRAGRGCFLRSQPSPYTKKVRRELLIEKIDAAVVTAHHLQVNADTFLKLVSERLGHFQGETGPRDDQPTTPGKNQPGKNQPGRTKP